MAGTYLKLGQRREIERFCAAMMSPSEIAERAGVSTQTIYRELKRGETGEFNEHFCRRIVPRSRSRTSGSP